ncbi:MAG: DUF3883 domain-containing protein [Bacteroidetes bacterium]|nr:DUF3883 domain-containing protein [Bacteroidota bacterium]
MPRNWSISEVQAAVEDYFDMLRLELTGKKFNKTEHRKSLLPRLDHRSEGSVELKHQNISAVLIEMGAPYISGYKPRANYQRKLLPQVVAEYLRNNPHFQTLFHSDSDFTPIVPSVGDILSRMEKPPVPAKRRPRVVTDVPSRFSPVRINYLEREAQNLSLGEAGERFVINYERARLIHAGKDGLADRIEQVSSTIGPSAGYDIRSFELNGSDRFIEAKTTKYGKETPFFVTPNELRFSERHASRYRLYRVFGFRMEPHLFTLSGHLEDQCTLEAFLFLARPR